jgi:CTP:molybdopterin cytidylyltransferase MocA
VLGAQAEAARAAVRMDRLPADEGNEEPAILWMINDAWAKGRAGSLQCGLRAIPPAITGVVIHAVDHPEVRPETIAALVAAHARTIPSLHDGPAIASSPTGPDGSIAATSAASPPGCRQAPPEPMDGWVVLPVHGGRHGHPVLLARAVWPEVLALAPDDSLRTVVHRDAQRLREVEVDDPGIHRNRNNREPGDIAPATHPERGDR